MTSASMQDVAAARVRRPREAIDLFVCHVPLDVRERLPAFIVRTDRVVPVALEGDVLVVVMEDPDNYDLRCKIEFVADRELRVVVATSAVIDNLIETYFPVGHDNDDD